VRAFRLLFFAGSQSLGAHEEELVGFSLTVADLFADCRGPCADFATFFHFDTGSFTVESLALTFLVVPLSVSSSLSRRLRVCLRV